MILFPIALNTYACYIRYKGILCYMGVYTVANG